MEQGPANITLTIFTPAFNRAHLLPRLFESIKSQVRPGDPVEWLVIDDGSTDSTAETVTRMKNERPDLVRLVRTKNGGKHRAINRLAQVAFGGWVMTVDSDDLLKTGAVGEALDAIGFVDCDPSIGVIRALKSFPELKTEYYFKVPSNPCRHSDWLSAQHQFETADIVRLMVLKMCPFPEIENERFMAESWLWHSVGRTHLTLYINKLWIECFYQNDGLSVASRLNRADSPCSAELVYAAMLESELPIRTRLRSSINWWRYHFHALSRNLSHRPEYRAPAGYAFLGWLMWVRDRFDRH